MFGRLTWENKYTRLDEMALLIFLRQWWRKHAGSYNDGYLRTELCTNTLRFIETNLPPQKQHNTLVGVNCSNSINSPSVINNGKIRINITYACKITEDSTTYKFLLPDDFDRIILPLWKFEKL